MTPEEIKSLRKNKGLTQEQLATMMQVDSTTIYRWESGIVTPSLVKTAILRDILIKVGDGRTHPFVHHLLSRNLATAILDFHGVYYEVNDSYEKLMGQSRVELVSNSAWEILEELTKAIEDTSTVNLDKFVQGKTACIRAENIKNSTTGDLQDHELHVVAQKDFSTIIVHEMRPSQNGKKWAIVTVDPKF
ncbi:MAG: helix-turn-helix domain-containing protein [Rhizobiaceae bacterium]|nr:helix-turn-helix domain-containing protein [Rhizobiaceae bacterium]